MTAGGVGLGLLIGGLVGGLFVQYKRRKEAEEPWSDGSVDDDRDESDERAPLLEDSS